MQAKLGGLADRELMHAELQHRKKRFQDWGTAVHASMLKEMGIEAERETEREVQTEVETVREVQQGLLYPALKVKKLRWDIVHFEMYGRLVASSDAYQPMFSVLERETALDLKHTVNPSMKSDLWISAQFIRAVEIYEPNDNYARPCHWILWSSNSQHALLISLEEADALIPITRERQPVESDNNMRLLVYAAPVTRRMLHFNQLD
jgi:hypothetical protein